MTEKKDDAVKRLNAVSKAFREFVLEAGAKELEEAIASEGEDPEELAKQGRAISARALERYQERLQMEERERADSEALHEGLGALVQLLRRREGMSEEDLAEKARVDIEEIRRIECDRGYTPNPRTIYQLERLFELPSRTLVVLAGVTRRKSPEFTSEVMRFAANAKTMGKLSRAERKLLDQFVKFLSSQEIEKG